MDDLSSEQRSQNCLLIGLGEVGTVHSLPAQLRAKWAAAAEHQLPDRSLGDLQARLSAADANRQSYLSSRTRFPKRPRSPASYDVSPSERVQEIEARLASAEASRQSGLEARRAKAARNLRKVLEAMARVSERQRDKAAHIDQSLAAAAERRSALLQLDSTRMAAMHAAAAARRAGKDAEWQRAAAALTQRLEQAAAARQAQLAAAAARMAEQGAQAKAIARQVRASKQARLQAKAAALQQRQERASQTRHEIVQAFVHSLPHAGGGSWQLRSGKDLKRLQRQVSSRKLQKFWKSFRTTRSTTAQLAQAFLDTGIPTSAQGMSREPSLDMDDDAAPAVAVMGPRTGLLSADGKPAKPRDSFERFAATMRAPASLRAAQALLRRLSAKWTAAIGSTCADPASSQIPGLLRQLRMAPRNPALERYPTRVFMCAYMVLRHPEVVFSQLGDRERSLAAAAEHLVAAFEAVLHRVLEVQRLRPASAASTNQSEGGLASEASTGPEATFGLLLGAWDRAWGLYLHQFAAWKSTDAANLEGELVRMATELETSLLAKTGREGAASPVVAASDDLQAMVEQMQRDHALLRARIQRLGGPAGIARLEAALAAVRANAPATPPSPPRVSPRGTPPRTPAAAPPQAPLGAKQRDPNEALAWELLYDAAWIMPTTELDALWQDATGATDVMTEAAEPPEDQEPQEKIQAVQIRIRRIAERALWDRLAGDLAQQMTQGGAQAAGTLAGLMAQVAGELAEALPPNARQLSQQLEPLQHVADVSQALTGPQAAGSLDLAAVLQHLHLLSQIVQAAGAPARAQPAQAAQEALQAQLGPAQAARDLPALAKGLIKAVTLLRAQAKFLRMDVANSRLAMLAHSMKDGAGLRYAHQKFLAAEGLSQDCPPGQLAEHLPRTRAFLAAASGKLPSLEAGLPASASSSQPSTVPSELRTGLRATGPARSAEQGAKQPAARLELGAPLKSWRGLVRAGLADMMAQATSSGTGEVPETLALDAPRLHAAQNAFQLLVVQATCLLLLTQSQGGRPPAGPQSVKARIAVLLADPSSRLADIAAELARLAAADNAGSAPSAASLESALQKLLAQQGPGLKVLKATLSQALLACLLSGPEANVSALLARVGAGVLQKEVGELAQSLGQIAAIGEAVHGPVYDALSSDLL